MIYGEDYILPYISCGGYYNEQGDWQQGAGEWGEPIECDAGQPLTGQAATITDNGNNAVQCSYAVTLEPDVKTFNVGDKVRLSVGSEEEQEYTVKGFRRYNTTARLWL